MQVVQLKLYLLFLSVTPHQFAPFWMLYWCLIFFGSVTPTVGGRNAGWRAEVVHFPKEKLSVAGGIALTIQPTAFASVAVGYKLLYSWENLVILFNTEYCSKKNLYDSNIRSQC